MHDLDSTYLITEELKNLRCIVRRFGIYFVVISLIPLAIATIALMLMGATVGGLFGGTAGNAARTQAKNIETAQQALNEQQLSELVYAVERLQQQIQRKPSSSFGVYPSNDVPTIRKATPAFPNSSR